MQKTIKRFTYLTIIFNITLTILWTALLIELAISHFSLKWSINLTFLLIIINFMVVFSIGFLMLTISRRINDRFLFKLNLMNILPIPYLSLASFIMFTILVVKSHNANDKEMVYDNHKDIQNLINN